MNKEILSHYLKKISKIDLELIWNLRVLDNWETVINTAIFKKRFFDRFNQNIDKYKTKFFLDLWRKENKLLRIKLDIEIDFEQWSLEKLQKDILYSEINVNLAKINFLKETYDIEASKIDWTYIYTPKRIHYNYYNRILFWISKIEATKNFNPKICTSFTNNISKQQLTKLINFSKKINPKIKFKFWKYNNFQFLNDYIKITNKEKYNIQNIISIFFHETTHFYRKQNAINNFWYAHNFSDYTSLEEWISLYNEYKYWNMITSYWEYIPYYDYCYNILNSDLQEKEKIKSIHNILKCKWYNKIKSLNYYYRFFRYSPLWGKDFFLKDLIYANAYKNVSSLIKQDQNNYEIIMSGKIWLNEIKQKHFYVQNNENSKQYFDKMVKKIIEVIS